MKITRCLSIVVSGLLLVSLALAGCGGPEPVVTPVPAPATSPVPTTSRLTPTPLPTTPTPTPTLTVTVIPSPKPAPPARYNLTTSVKPEGSGSIVPSSGQYDAGARVTLLAIPANPGWAFEGWTGGVDSVASSVEITLNADRTVIANFVKRKFPLTVSVSPPDAGKVGPTGGAYDYSERVTLVATPAPDFIFDRWGGDASGTSADVTLTVQSAKNVIAYFKSEYQTITRETLPGSAVVNTISFTNQLKAGESVKGYVQISGEYHPEDVYYSWEFSIKGPQAVVLSNYLGSLLSTPRHEIDKTVQFDGVYTMTVTHTSRWPKNVTIRIRPGGWIG